MLKQKFFVCFVKTCCYFVAVFFVESRSLYDVICLQKMRIRNMNILNSTYLNEQNERN